MGADSFIISGKVGKHMYRVWYWVIVDRDEAEGFVARAPDFVDIFAYGATEKEAIAALSYQVSSCVCRLVESGETVPRARQSSEIGVELYSKEFSRTLISVPVPRRAARPYAAYMVKEEPAEGHRHHKLGR